MTRLGVVFWMVLVAVAGFTTFKVKYAVQDIEDQLNRVRKQTLAEQQEVRVLTAEWTYLNQPERLAELNRRFLALAPITAKQLQRSIADIPLRAPPAAPDVVVAAAPEPAASQTPAAGPPVTQVALTTPPVISERPWAEAPRTGAVGPAERPSGAAPLQLTKAAPVQLAKAGPSDAPNSLDALIAQIADAR